jgi:hypothetical protein
LHHLFLPLLSNVLYDGSYFSTFFPIYEEP